jgi:NAD(P)-dependent dehydrogenase (short-subunit alcohol dehydrogenase family)
MKTIVVSGATSGIGLSVVKGLMKNNEFIIALGRNKEACQKARLMVDPDNNYYNLIYLPADLASLEDIKEVSNQIKEITNNKGIDVLINNAATVPKWYLTTKEGYEMQFAVNHLAGFYLMQLLLPDLMTKQGTIITTSSRSHRLSRLNFKDLMLTKNYHILRGYKRSKLCNVLTTYEFNRRYQRDNLIAYAIDPGLVNTNIGAKKTSGLIQWFWQTRAKKGKMPDEIAPFYLDLIYKDKDYTAPYYYKYGKKLSPSKYSQNINHARRLWEESLSLIGGVK